MFNTTEIEMCQSLKEIIDSNLKASLRGSDDCVGGADMDIVQNYSVHNENISMEIKKDIINLKKVGQQVELVWIPSHTNIYGNDMADLLAKMGTNNPPNADIKTDHKNLWPLHQSKIWERLLSNGMTRIFCV
ncbi:hypothetical protein WA026_016507 [Henosepilachna vigintioctopunctata]|uniref:RNase H type-1 domain-containing protein n=1 Tax=Henosepilachna vigintioctopunctata TaxID=420089 RepID=A0AAW1V8R0_9CUCU